MLNTVSHPPVEYKTWKQLPGPYPLYQCQLCGAAVEFRDDRDIPAFLETYRHCPMPPIVVKATHNLLRRYAEAINRWIRAGRPVRSDQRVKEIYETHCRPCEKFDAKKQTCTICGCRVRKSGVALMNKIKMATESCPDTPPKWEAEL